MSAGWVQTGRAGMVWDGGTVTCVRRVGDDLGCWRCRVLVVPFEQILRTIGGDLYQAQVFTRHSSEQNEFQKQDLDFLAFVRYIAS